MRSRLIDLYRRRRGYAKLPWGIDLLLTDACNLRCSYCPIWGENSKLPAPAAFMDTGAALRLVSEVAAFRPMIRLFGGEPFIHPEWRKVEIYTTVTAATYEHLSAWAGELSSWGIDKLRLQHLIWFSSDQLQTSLELLRGVMPDPAFFRAEDASYCQDEVPRMDVARLA